MTKVLTGMQASGYPHIGNYFGMMKPSVELQDDPNNECYYFIADLHSFTTKRSAEDFHQNQKNCVLDWLAVGIDPEKSVFYRQSDVRAHTELAWFLACQTPLGLLERAHSFKDKKAKGLDTNTGLFTYPVLMAADILLYDAEIIPVGKDQIQHVEMARDIAQKFNHNYGETFVLPQSKVDDNVMTIPGLDGAKMSKSYNNTIPVFADEKTLKKKIMSIKTESMNLGDPINPTTCAVFAFHELFANPELEGLRAKYQNGEIGFGDSKKMLFELVWDYFAKARERRAKFSQDDKLVADILQKGAKKATVIADKKLGEVREKLGLSANHLGSL